MNTVTGTTASAYPPPPSINLTQRQFMLGLAYMAYCGEGLATPNPAQAILQNINYAMTKIMLPGASQPLFTGWNVVWGPAAYTAPGSLYQDNVMYVVNNTNVSGQYAIAIRGTNFINEVDWLLEDFNVRQLMTWPLGATTSVPAGAAVAESTSIDLTTLLSMQDTGGTTLLDFLRSTTAGGAVNICVTGHSLGAILASTLALYLLETQSNASSWDSNGSSTVTCITFAGPTAGNLQFANYSNATFAAAARPPAAVWDNTLATNCDIIQSAYDVAPLMYNGANIENITATYGNNIPFTQLTGTPFEEYALFLGFLIEASSLTYAQNYTQLAVANPGGAFPGVFNPPATPLPPPTSTDPTLLLQYLEAFVEQAAWQHSNSYPNLLNIPDLLDTTIIVRNVVSVSMASFSKAFFFREETYQITITGIGFSSLTNPVLYVIGGEGVSITSVDSDTQITASVNIPSTVSMGLYYVVLSGNNGTAAFVTSGTYQITVA